MSTGQRGKQLAKSGMSGTRKLEEICDALQSLGGQGAGAPLCRDFQRTVGFFVSSLPASVGAAVALLTRKICPAAREVPREPTLAGYAPRRNHGSTGWAFAANSNELG